MASRIPTDILTGFLGSGKTTLLNRLLAQGGFANTAVVVNELGEIGLDHLLVTQRGDQIALLEGGCLCCAVVDSLPETLLELCRKRAGGEVPRFDRIVIETTGLANPGPIHQVLSRSPLLAHFLQPGVVVTAFDTLAGRRAIDRHPEALAQLVLADRIVLTKLDQPSAWNDADRDALHAINPLAELLTAAEIVAQPSRLVAPAEGAEGAVVRGAGATAHSHGVAAYSFALDAAVSWSGLAAWSSVLSHRLGDDLLRCKGIVAIGSRRVLVQGVGTRFQFEDAPACAAGLPASLTCIVQHHDRETIAALLPWLYVPEGTQPPAPEDLS